MYFWNISPGFDLMLVFERFFCLFNFASMLAKFLSLLVQKYLQFRWQHFTGKVSHVLVMYGMMYVLCMRVCVCDGVFMPLGVYVMSTLGWQCLVYVYWGMSIREEVDFCLVRMLDWPTHSAQV